MCSAGHQLNMSSLKAYSLVLSWSMSLARLFAKVFAMSAGCLTIDFIQLMDRWNGL